MWPFKKKSPFGKIIEETVKFPGIVAISTPSHHALKLNEECNSKVHEAWRDPNGWYPYDKYEDNCGDHRHKVTISFPELYPGDKVYQAHKQARDYFPDEYAKATGGIVIEENSRVLRKRAFKAKKASQWYVQEVHWGKGLFETNRLDEKIQTHIVVTAWFRMNPASEKRFLIPYKEYKNGETYWGFTFQEGQYPEYKG